MGNLFIFNETFTNGLNYGVVYFITFASVLCGIFVIISKNPIVSVLFLIGLFLSIASYLMMLGMNFIGLSYLLVYVGAVSILFLFILMLINVRISELSSNTSNSIPLAIMTSIFFILILYKLLPSNITAPNTLYMQNEFKEMETVIGGYMVSNNNVAYPLNEYLNLLYNNDISFVTSHM